MLAKQLREQSSLLQAAKHFEFFAIQVQFHLVGQALDIALAQGLVIHLSLIHI